MLCEFEVGAFTIREGGINAPTVTCTAVDSLQQVGFLFGQGDSSDGGGDGLLHIHLDYFFITRMRIKSVVLAASVSL